MQRWNVLEDLEQTLTLGVLSGIEHAFWGFI